MKDERNVIDRKMEVNGINFHFREWRKADAPLIILLHGLTGHAWEFDSVASSLSGQFHVIALNQRGHGASSWAEDYSPTKFVVSPVPLQRLFEK